MSGRVRRSITTTVRVSLISVGGALGLLTLSAGTATADDVVSGHTLTGSVASVVESVAAPVESLAGELLPSGPEASVPGTQGAVQPSVADLVGSVPEVVGNLSAVETVAPLTELVDSTVSQVPVINQVLPVDTATAITQPVLETVDSGLAPVLAPVEQSLTPVVEVLDPVAGVVDSVIVPVVTAPPVPVPVKVPEPVMVPEPVVPVSAPEPIDTETVEVPGAGSTSGESAAAEVPAPATAESAISEGEERSPSRDTNAQVLLPQMAEAASSSLVGAYVTMQELLTLVPGDAVGNTAGDPMPATSPGSAAGTAGPGGPAAADAIPGWGITLISGNSHFIHAANALLQSPAFDPGSTPD